MIPRTRTFLSRTACALAAAGLILAATALFGCDTGGSHGSKGKKVGPGAGTGSGGGSGSGTGTGTGSGSGSGTGGTVSGGTTSSGGGPVGPSPSSGPALYVSGWFPNWEAGSIQSVFGNAGVLDEVNPTWYALRADGTLTARSWARDPQFVADCHALGIEVLPMIDDFQATGGAGPVVRDPVLAATLRDAILAEVDAYGLDGIDIDFEGMGEVSRDAFSLFMADLATHLHARGKVLSAAVYGKTSEPGGWSGPKSHDYAALGASVDRFKIMMYGWDGPVAPNDWIERVTTFALTAVPADRIYIGVPFFGWDRPASGSKRALTESTAEQLRQQVGATAAFDPVEGETTFSYVDASGIPHEVWYQDGRALASKCDLAKRLGVRGIAIWRLGGELADIWQAIAAAR